MHHTTATLPYTVWRQVREGCGQIERLLNAEVPFTTDLPQKMGYVR